MRRSREMVGRAYLANRRYVRRRLRRKVVTMFETEPEDLVAELRPIFLGTRVLVGVDTTARNARSTPITVSRIVPSSPSV